MLEENKDNLTAGEAPREVVDWYVPHRAAPPREVVDCYVHTRALPGGARPAPAPEKRKRTGLWIFLGCVAGLLAAVVLGAVIYAQRAPALPDDYSEMDPDEGNPSSIVHIFGDSSIAIPRYDPKGTAEMLTVTREAGPELTPQEVYAKVAPSTVVVLARGASGTFLGTGIIMSADGYVITNAHVIADGREAYVATYWGELFDARLVGADQDNDVAVLKMMDVDDLPVAEFGSSDDCLVGDTAYAIGNPLGLELMGTMTEGIISAVNRTIRNDGREVTTLQTTAALNNGNSGGPLINASGQVIGITTLKMSNKSYRDEATVEGLGFALPINEASYVINSILATGAYAGKPTFGVLVITEDTAGGGEQLKIAEVTEGGACEKAGVQAGDVILAVKGQEITNTADMMAVRRTCLAGDTVTVKLLRSGKTFEVEVTLLPGE